MDPVLILAIACGCGVFIAVAAIGRPPRVRLERPDPGRRGLGWLQARLDAAELSITAREFVTTCLAFVLIGTLLALLLGAPVLGLVLVVLVPALLWQRYETQRDRFRRAYETSLAEIAQLLREGFAATGALRDALDHAVRNGPEPAVLDFREVLHGRATGMSLEEAFEPVMERRKNPFLNLIAEALTLKAAEGGDAGKVLLGLEHMIREQTALKREIFAKQSQARLESMLISAAPLAFFLMMKLLPWMKDYELGFYNTALGQVILVLAAVFSLLSFTLSQRLATRGLTLEVKEVAS